MNMKDTIQMIYDKMMGRQETQKLLAYEYEPPSSVRGALDATVYQGPPLMVTGLSFSVEPTLLQLSSPQHDWVFSSDQSSKIKTLEQKLADAEADHMNIAILWGKEREENMKLKKRIAELELLVGPPTR